MGETRSWSAWVGSSTQLGVKEDEKVGEDSSPPKLISGQLHGYRANGEMRTLMCCRRSRVPGLVLPSSRLARCFRKGPS